MSESQSIVAAGRPALDYLPVGLFGSVMGLTGLSVAWRRAHARYGAPDWIAVTIAALAMLAFVLLAAGYLVKLMTAFTVVRTEFRHPIAGNLFGLPPMHGLMVFALAVGLFFALPLFTLVFSRLLFEPPLPDPLRPSLLILVAPFAVGYSAYTFTTGQTDMFAEALYMLTLFVLAVLLGQLRNLPLCCPFRVAWWAVSFPLAANSIAALRFAAAQPGIITDTIAIALLALASLVIVALLGRTVLGVFKGELRTLSS